MLLLRPHHINCIFFYKGIGYSKDFIEGMDNILNLVKKEPNTKILYIFHYLMFLYKHILYSNIMSYLPYTNVLFSFLILIISL